jgi:hypothetical protein
LKQENLVKTMCIAGTLSKQQQGNMEMCISGRFTIQQGESLHTPSSHHLCILQSHAGPDPPVHSLCNKVYFGRRQKTWSEATLARLGCPAGDKQNGRRMRVRSPSNQMDQLHMTHASIITCAAKNKHFSATTDALLLKTA